MGQEISRSYILDQCHMSQYGANWDDVGKA